MVADLRNRRGLQTIFCRLETSLGEWWHYEVSTTVYDRGNYKTPLLSFGSVPVGSVVNKETEFYARSTEARLLPTAFRLTTSHAGLQVHQGGSTTGEESGILTRVVPLKITLRASSRPGLNQANVQMTGSWGDEEKAYPLAITWNVQSLYAVEPAHVFFGPADTGVNTTVSRSVTLRRTDRGAFGVRKVDVPKPFTADVKSAVDRREHTLTIQVNPGDIGESSLWSEMTVTTDFALQPTLAIPLALAKPHQRP